MKLGFIGTGKITSSVVTGICRSKISFNKIILSPRSKSVSQTLKKKFKKISIAKNNQEILNSCNWIFLAVTPTVGQKIIKNLKFRPNHTIISFISTMTLPQLKKAIKVKAEIVRAIPLPPISLKKGPVPILFVALSEDAVVNSKKDLKHLVKESQTPRGLNEQGVKELRKAGFYRSTEKTLNSILKRLNKV